MLLLFLITGDALWLVSGQSLSCDSYRREHGTVLIHAGEMLYSLPAERVDWERTAREKEPPPAPAVVSKPAEKKRRQFSYEGFLIQKLDVTRTSLIDLLRFMADMVNINLYIDSSVADRKVTYFFKNIPWDQALTIILFDAGLDFRIQSRMLHVRG